ncbi:MAG: ABC transporter substrate-binding protein [Lachnospiraceae bacterium]|nr:ABC transporter substrate-binding protein [Lachnospiraceae bacterium]
MNRISRRDFLRGSAAAAVTGLFGGMTVPVFAEEAAEITDGGSITIRVSADPLNINPLYVTDLNSFTIMQALYSPFFEIVDGEVYYGNGLLESVEANDDSTQFTLTLKEGLTWHDGEPITADDIVFSMTTLLDEEQAVPYSTYGYDGDGNAAVTEAVDERVATITFQASNTGFLGSLSQIYCIPQHIYDGVSNIGESELNYEPVGSGPYQFVSYSSGQTYIVERFDGYFAGTPHLDQVVFMIIKDTNTAIAALQSGEIDALTISSEDYETVNALDGVTIYHYNSGQVNAMGLNMLNEDLAKTEVRQAIAYALNKEELVTFAYVSTEYATPAYSILTPDTLYYTDDLTLYDNDLEKAKELMEEAGVSSLSLSLLYSTSADEMEKEAIYIQSMLAQIGITVTLQPQEDSVFKNTLQEIGSTAYDLVLENWELGAEPSLYADIITSGSRSNHSNVSDEELDALWAQGLATPDGEERESIYHEIQELINDQQYIYTISYSNGFYAMSNAFGGFDDFLLQTIYLDYSQLYAVQ